MAAKSAPVQMVRPAHWWALVLIGLILQASDPRKYGLARDLFSFEPYAFMVRRNDADFRLVADRALAQIYRSGQIEQLYQGQEAAVQRAVHGHRDRDNRHLRTGAIYLGDHTGRARCDRRHDPNPRHTFLAHHPVLGSLAKADSIRRQQFRPRNEQPLTAHRAQ